LIEKLAGLIPSPRYYAPRIHYRLTHQIATSHLAIGQVRSTAPVPAASGIPRP